MTKTATTEERIIAVPVGEREYRIPYRGPDRFTLGEHIELEKIMLMGRHSGAEASLLALQVLAQARTRQRVNVDALKREALDVVAIDEAVNELLEPFASTMRERTRRRQLKDAQRLQGAALEQEISIRRREIALLEGLRKLASAEEVTVETTA